MRYLPFILAVFSVFLNQNCRSGRQSKSDFSTQVLVVGGGTGGTAAALQSARLGAKTLLAEPTPWLGGMLSVAGISATDGNHRLPSGLWAEFREAIYRHYGGPDAVNTGWISNTHFEPHVADAILKKMCSREKHLTVLYGFDFQKVIKKNGRVAGVVFKNKKTGKTRAVAAEIVVDATELGDVLAEAGAAFQVGMDARETTGEAGAPIVAQPQHIQDLTWAAIVKDYGPGADKTIPPPPGYDPERYRCCCADRCPRAEKMHACSTMLRYARLPNGKILLNWPNEGNDVFLDMINMTPEQRETAAAETKNATLGYLHFIQTELGHKNLGLADDEFPTPDRLPFIPYHRESRRLVGLSRLTVNHLLDPFGQPEALYRTGISVGDYPLDHHHKKNPEALAIEVEFPKIPSFNVPLGTLVPVDIQGLIVAEKSISVTHIVNGATRLQPCVLLTGQAAGALAAHCIFQKKQPREADIRAVQKMLLDAGAFLMPYLDVLPTDPAWQAVQRVGASGLLRGRGEPHGWANRTWFDPDSALVNLDLLEGLQAWQPGFYANVRLRRQDLSIAEVVAMLDNFFKNEKTTYSEPARRAKTESDFLKKWLSENWTTTLQLADFQEERRITRREMAVVLDAVLNPFERKIGWDGHFFQQEK